MSEMPTQREFATVEEAVDRTLEESIWYVDTPESIRAPYEVPTNPDRKRRLIFNAEDAVKFFHNGN